jgi:4-hydroxy-tetrahydrodipicolinate synthase
MPASDTTAARSAAVERLTALRGTLVPLVTPVDERGRVSPRDMAALMGSLRGAVAGWLPALSTGEGWRLSERQWDDVVRLTVELAGGAPVLAGAETGDTRRIARLARRAAGLGADAVVVPPPFPAEGGPVPGLVEHYTAVLEESPLPVFVYHETVLSRTAPDVEALAEVCALPGIVGVKESSGDADFTRRLLAAGAAVPVFQGWEHLITAVPGVSGFVGPLANLEPAACDAALADGSPAAQERVDALCRRHRLLADDWYLHVKQELVTRGLIGTALAVPRMEGDDG